MTATQVGLAPYTGVGLEGAGKYTAGLEVMHGDGRVGGRRTYCVVTPPPCKRGMDPAERVALQGRRYPPPPHLLPPSRVTIARMTEERVDLYWRVTPPGRRITVVLDPLPVYKFVTEEEEVAR